MKFMGDKRKRSYKPNQLKVEFHQEPKVVSRRDYGKRQVRKPIVYVLPNRQICFGGKGLSLKMPLNPNAASHFKEILSAFAKYVIQTRFESLE